MNSNPINCRFKIIKFEAVQREAFSYRRANPHSRYQKRNRERFAMESEHDTTLRAQRANASPSAKLLTYKWRIGLCSRFLIGHSPNPTLTVIITSDNAKIGCQLCMIRQSRTTNAQVQCHSIIFSARAFTEDFGNDRNRGYITRSLGKP
jgi:hypothetical protein